MMAVLQQAIEHYMGLSKDDLQAAHGLQMSVRSY